jgi:hypothetical protein
MESTGGRVCDYLQDLLNDDCYDADSDFHHALAIANLVDSCVINDGLAVGNRKEYSVGAG